MAQQFLTGGNGLSGQNGLSSRTVIDANFTELYDAVGDIGPTAFADVTGVAADNSSLVSYVASQISAAVAGLIDLRGAYDASGNAYPSSGGSGSAGAILKGDAWVISVAGTLTTGRVVSPGDVLFAVIDTPGSTAANWAIIENNLTYSPVNKAGDSMSGNLAMNTNKVTGLAAASSNGDAVRFEQIPDISGLAPIASPTFTGTPAAPTPAVTVNTTQLATTSMVQSRVLKAYVGTGTDTYSVTVDGLAAYAAGQIFDVSFPNTNTTVATLNVNTLGAKNLYKNYSTPLTSGDLVPNQIYRVYYNGTSFHIVNGQIRQRVYNVDAYGARHDYQTVSTASVTSASTALTVSAGVFTSADTGKTIRVFGAGAAGIDLITTMTYVSATAVTLGAAASTTVSAKQIEWGTDDTNYIQQAIDECFTRGGGTIYFPNGTYFIAGPLLTSVDSINPNCQIVIPLSSLSETKRSIQFIGESVVMWPSGPVAAQNLPTKGVILKSIIVGSGTLPSVFGASYAYDGFTNGNATTPIFENMCVMVKSIAGISHIAPKMSAFKLHYCGAKQLKNVIAMSESDPTESILPVDETYGFYLSQQAHTDTHSWYENITAANFYYGFRIDEHDTYNRLNAYTCLHAVAIGGNGSNSHPIIPGGAVNNNWCKYGITFLGQKTVWMEYYAERWPGAFSTRWFDGTADVYFPSTAAVQGQIVGKVVLAGGGAATMIVSGAFTGNLSIRDIVAGPTFSYTTSKMTVSSAGDDIITATGSGTGRSGFLATSTSSTGQATLYMDNNRGSFASYGGVMVGGSAHASSFFGLTRADKFFLFADGASNLGMAIGTLQAQQLVFGTADTNRMSISGTGSLAMERTFTAAGTTGARTISKMSGSVNFAAAATTLVVTNTLVTTSSIVILTVHGTDATATSARVTTASGSFTITLNAAATAETRVSFLVIN